MYQLFTYINVIIVLAIICAVVLVTHHSIIISIFCLVFLIKCCILLILFLRLEFLGLAFLLLYVGGLIILFLFVSIVINIDSALKMQVTSIEYIIIFFIFFSLFTKNIINILNLDVISIYILQRIVFNKTFLVNSDLNAIAYLLYTDCCVLFLICGFLLLQSLCCSLLLLFTI